MSGPSVRLDPRIHAVRRDIADIGLADRIFAPHYAEPEKCRCIAARAMLLDAPNPNARAVSQILHGEGFAVVDSAGGWAWGYSLHDGYVGYIPQTALGEGKTGTHIVRNVAAPIFTDPDIKSTVRAIVPIGARLHGKEEGVFLALAEGFVHLRHVQPAGACEADPVAVAERLLGLPYLWGGRGGDGVDCSGLVQLALAFAGVDAPRDSDQQRALGEEIEVDEALRRGDLVFFPGHVGFMADGERLLHANAHWMAVTIEPLADIVARLGPQYDNPIIARRRISL